jgi:hypothetical protein
MDHRIHIAFDTLFSSPAEIMDAIFLQINIADMSTPTFHFKKLNNNDQPFQLTGPELSSKFMEFLLLQAFEQIQGYSPEVIIRVFVSGDFPNSLMAVPEESEFRKMVVILRPIYKDCLAKFTQTTPHNN